MFDNYKLKRKIRIFRRYREIIEVLVKHGFGEVLGRMNVAARLRIGKRQLFKKTSDLASKHYSERIRLALEELGPTFIKLGQVMSTRPFLIPVDLVLELAKLQDEVAPFEYEKVKEIIERELRQPLEQVFKSFDEKPVASASLAQVHRAVLQDGSKVAVKVQRPDVKKIMDVDMEILRDLAGLLERYIPESKRFDPSGQVSELAKVSRRECDFKFEARNMDIFKINFENMEKVRVPDVLWEYTTSKLLIAEFIEGSKISNLPELQRLGIDLQDLSRNGLRVVMKMVFEDKFFHADPHPGNLLVQDDGTLALLDFGMVGYISQSVVDFFTNLLMAAASWDARKIIHVILDFDLVPEDVDQLALETDLTELLYRYHKIPLGQIDMRALITDCMDIFYRHDVRLMSSFMILMKALMTAEEVARMLDPDINMIAEIEPYIRELASKRYKFSTFKDDLISTGSDLRELAITLPFDIKRITQKIRKGEMEVQFHHRGLEDLKDELYQSSKRVSLSLIIAAILVSAALLKRADLGLKILGFPVLSLLGFLLGGALSMWVIINILRSQRSK